MFIKTPVIVSSEMLFVSLMVSVPVLLGCSLVRLAEEDTVAVWSDSGLCKPTKRFNWGCALIFVTVGEAELCSVAVFFKKCALESDLLW